jgi:hypothetical protein
MNSRADIRKPVENGLEKSDRLAKLDWTGTLQRKTNKLSSSLRPPHTIIISLLDKALPMEKPSL